jgi:hypothetical protein
MVGRIRRINKTITQRDDSIFGEGTDGAVTISSGTTYLTKDMYYTNLTINSGATLFTNGFRVFVNGTLTNNGTLGMPTLTAATVADGSGTVAGRQNALNPAKAWGTSTDALSVTDMHDMDDAVSGWFITSAGAITKIGSGSLGVAGSSGNVAAATAGNYPGHSNTVGAAGGTGNAATAGTGGAGGLGGGLVIVLAKNISGTGYIVSYGFAGNPGNPAVQGNPAPNISGYHTGGFYHHAINGHRISPATSNQNSPHHNHGNHNHNAGVLPGNPTNATGVVNAGHHPATNNHAHASHGTNHNSGSNFSNSPPYVIYVLAHNGGTNHNSGNGHHHHPANGSRPSPHQANSNAAHHSHGSHTHTPVHIFGHATSNHNGSHSCDCNHGAHHHNPGHGHHAGNHNAGNHPYPHGVGGHGSGPNPTSHNAHAVTHPGHGHHHTAETPHGASNPHSYGGAKGIPHSALVLGHNGSNPHTSGSHPHGAGSTGPSPNATITAGSHNAGDHTHTAATVNHSSGAVTSNRTAAPTHTATNANYTGGSGGTANPGNTGATGSTGGIIVVTRNAGNAANQLGHSNYSKILDI